MLQGSGKRHDQQVKIFPKNDLFFSPGPSAVSLQGKPLKNHSGREAIWMADCVPGPWQEVLPEIRFHKMSGV